MQIISSVSTACHKAWRSLCFLIPNKKGIIKGGGFIVLLSIFLTNAMARDGITTVCATENGNVAPVERNAELYGNVFTKAFSGITIDLNGLMGDGTSINDTGEKVLSTCLKYIPVFGIGVFVLGMIIAMFSIKNNSNRRWGLRMGIISSLVLYLIYVLLAVLYDYVYKDAPLQELVRPENLDFYGSVYFDTVERILHLQQMAGFAQETLSKNVFAVLTDFYLNSAVDISVAVVVLCLILSALSRGNPPLRRWARVLCVIVPVLLYFGVWYMGMM